MRFITEFELKHPYTPTRGYNSKKEMQDEMGKMIGVSFGWKEKALSAFTRHTLEIEAFPMEKWIEFKQNIIAASRRGRSNRTNDIIEMIEELESFGKPAGDTITNTQ